MHSGPARSGIVIGNHPEAAIASEYCRLKYCLPSFGSICAGMPIQGALPLLSFFIRVRLKGLFYHMETRWQYQPLAIGIGIAIGFRVANFDCYADSDSDCRGN